jgi:hypothetical protein
VIGFFANYAQNEYGLRLAGFSLSLLSGLFLINSLTALKTSRPFTDTLMLSLALVCVSSHHPPTTLILIPVSSFLFVLIHLIASKFRGKSNLKAWSIGAYLQVLIPSWAVIPTIFSEPVIYIMIGYLILVLQPIFIFFRERKSENKSSIKHYYEFLFIGMLCQGISFKGFHYAGSSMILVLSMLIAVLYIHQIIMERKSFKGWTGLSRLILMISFGAMVMGIVFKAQHWPGANQMMMGARNIFLLMLISYPLAIYKEQMKAGSALGPVKALLLPIMLVITLHGTLRSLEWVPPFYSNSMPAAYEEIDAKANNITAEGRKYMKIKSDYQDEYYGMKDEYFASENE